MISLKLDKTLQSMYIAEHEIIRNGGILNPLLLVQALQTDHVFVLKKIIKTFSIPFLTFHYF